MNKNCFWATKTKVSNISVFIPKAKSSHTEVLLQTSVLWQWLVCWCSNCFFLFPENVTSLFHFQLEMTMWLSSSHRKVTRSDRHCSQAWSLYSLYKIWIPTHFALPAGWRQAWWLKAIAKSHRWKKPGFFPAHSMEVSCSLISNSYFRLYENKKYISVSCEPLLR